MKLMYKLLSVGIIIIISIVLLLHYVQVYNANKNMDEFFFIKGRDGELYTISMSDEAKELPVFFYRWKCNAYLDDINNKYLECNHCRLLSTKCSKFNFPVILLYGEDKKEIEDKLKQTESKNNKILFFSLLGIVCCFFYWYWLWKKKPDEWEKTPFARIIRWFEDKMEEENKNEINKE